MFGESMKPGDPADMDTSSALLAKTRYAPEPGVSKSTTSTTFVDVDATNLAVTFTAPSSGQVIVILQALCRVGDVAAVQHWNLREGAGDVADTGVWTTRETSAMTQRVAIHVSGLTAGTSYTWKWGYRTSNASWAAEMFLSDPDGTNDYGAGLIEVWEVPA